MRITRDLVGFTQPRVRPPVPVHAYTLTTLVGVSAVVWTYGATLVELNAPDTRGRIDNIVLRLPRLSDYEDPVANPSYLGATVGRYARCIAQGRFWLDEVSHQLSRNRGAHHLHGGADGFDRRVWHATTRAHSHELVLRLTLDSPDGDEGYPGQLGAAVEYRMRKDGQLTVVFEANTDAPTIVAMANHSYWNLASRGTVDQHVLKVESDAVVECGSDHVPTGQFALVADTALDFRAGCSLEARPVDHCFALTACPGRARLENPASGRILEILTDQPGLAVHTGENLPFPRAGVALQATDFPDAPNQTKFPSVVLRPGETYRRETRYRFSANA